MCVCAGWGAARINAIHGALSLALPLSVWSTPVRVCDSVGFMHATVRAHVTL